MLTKYDSSIQCQLDAYRRKEQAHVEDVSCHTDIGGSCSRSYHPFTGAIEFHDLTEAELQQLRSLGFKLATPEDRAAAKAAGIEWREVQSYAEILKLASELWSRLHNLNTEMFVGSKSVVRSFYGLGIPGKAKKESTVYDTVLCDAIMGAQVDQTYDPVSKRVRFSPPIHDKWWDVYGVCSFWLEDKWHSVSFPNGALKQSASATLVQPFGPSIFRKRISETVWWYS